jgi:protein TonB
VSPKPKPKIKAKPKASASPKKHASPKPSPKASPRKTPADDQGDDNGGDDNSTKAAKTAFKKATGHSTGETGGGGDGEAGTAPGTGGGKRGGKGHIGGGNTEDFGWYHTMLYDKFYARWDQPTSIVTETSKYSAQVKIRIEKDGTISDVSLAQSSGNDVMDQSVMEAARRVTQVDPPPEGLSKGGAYEVKINFELTH